MLFDLDYFALQPLLVIKGLIPELIPHIIKE